MRIVLTLALLILPLKVVAISPLPVEELTPDKADELGFESSFQYSKLESVFILTAPVNMHGCEFTTSAMHLTNKSGETLGAVMADVFIKNKKPTITVFLTRPSINYGVAVHYKCSKSLNKRGKVYLISSIKAYVAASLK